ncbi:MAG: hypothetical protein IT386_01995 [Deltaproteobacteria bacterium]|nr:hypothetical protein [Deltaproteobacteria bacterium]
MEFERMTGVEKAAVLALALSPDDSRELFAHLDDADLERVLVAVARVGEVPGPVRERVLAEYRDAVARNADALVGGRARALALARGTLDAERAARVCRGIGSEETRIDRTLAGFAPGFVARTLAGEHPQTIALVLSQLPEQRAAAVMGVLPESLGAEVVIRLASLGAVPADVLEEIEAGVAELFDEGRAPAAAVGGEEVAARILNRVPRAAGSAILDGVLCRAPEVASEIRRRMLRFDDLRRLDRRDFQTLLREISIEDLVLALKGSADEMREKVFENVSHRAADQIRAESELMGPARRSEVDAVRERIVESARRLADDGRIDLRGEESADELV